MHWSGGGYGLVTDDSSRCFRVLQEEVALFASKAAVFASVRFPRASRVDAVLLSYAGELCESRARRFRSLCLSCYGLAHPLRYGDARGCCFSFIGCMMM